MDHKDFFKLNIKPQTVVQLSLPLKFESTSKIVE